MELLDRIGTYIAYQGDYYTVAAQHGDTGNTSGDCDGYFVQVEKADQYSS